MGLAAFNRMRQLEEMKPENIRKEQEAIEAKEIETPVIDEPIKETNQDIPTEEVVEKEETKPTTRRRRTNS